MGNLLSKAKAIYPTIRLLVSKEEREKPHTENFLNLSPIKWLITAIYGCLFTIRSPQVHRFQIALGRLEWGTIPNPNLSPNSTLCRQFSAPQYGGIST
jgi:hypothetical protein